MLHFRSVRALVATALFISVISATVTSAVARDRSITEINVAQAHGTQEGELSPRYEPVPPQPKSSYNSEYLFGMTRGVAQSTVHPAVKVPLFVLTVPLDIVFLPFAAVGGFFG